MRRGTWKREHELPSFPFHCYTNPTYGALFITFHAGGDPRKAEAYFKTINGDIIDTFSIVKDGPSGQ
jgi:hypothetical protein